MALEWRENTKTTRVHVHKKLKNVACPNTLGTSNFSPISYTWLLGWVVL